MNGTFWGILSSDGVSQGFRLSPAHAGQAVQPLVPKEIPDFFGPDFSEEVIRQTTEAIGSQFFELGLQGSAWGSDLDNTLELDADSEMSGGTTAAFSVFRRRELDWSNSNQRALSVHAGQWVVLEGEEIIAHGENIAEAVRIARQRGIQRPFVFRVEEDNSDIIQMGL